MVNVGCFVDHAAIGADSPVCMIIGHDVDDVGSQGLRPGARSGKSERQHNNNCLELLHVTGFGLHCGARPMHVSA